MSVAEKLIADLFAKVDELSRENVGLRDQVVKHKASNEMLTEHIVTLRSMLERSCT